MDIQEILNELNTISKSYKNAFTNINGYDYPCDAWKLFEKYPKGFNDYVWFLHPHSNNWEAIAEEYCNTYFELKNDFEDDEVPGYEPQENEGFPFEFYPAKSGLVPWAQCDNGTVIYFISDGISSRIIVYGDGYEFYEYPLSVTEYLYKLINREIDCSAYLPCELFGGEIAID